MTNKHAIAQNFHAIQGSSYTGAASIFNNPASPINSLHKWDLNLFSVQLSNITNTLYFKDMKLPSISNASIQLKEGRFSRYNHQSIDLNLFNVMYQIDAKQSISGGLRIRSYAHFKTNSFEVNDSTDRMDEFLFNNRTTPFIQGNGIHAGWLEGNLNYSRVIKENNLGRLSGGITLQIAKNVSGAYTRINRFSYIETKLTPTDTVYTFTGGAGSYAYSSNYDAISPYINLQGNINQMIKSGTSSFGFSVGMEYILYDQSVTVGENEPKPYHWKIGMSIMDIGASNFKTSEYTGQFSNPTNSITDGDLSQKLSNINSAQDLRDSLATLFGTVTPLSPTFSVNHPTRMVINVDRHLGKHLFINGQLSLNFRSSSSSNKFNTRELSLLTITPRWETLAWGIYFPVQYNTQGQFWMGAAVKLGPLVAGIHSLGILKKDPLLNGGGYLMVSIHPFNKKMYTTRLDCF
ncbi:MAG: hypothetical protein EAZ12_00835 [Sphingobacteriia bacterium]|nr:MAG: hypothetical protein EAZ12_00835 [Sphingobacteriia bacterium]